MERDTKPLKVAVGGIDEEVEQLAVAKAVQVVSSPSHVGPEACSELLLHDISRVVVYPEGYETGVVEIVFGIPHSAEWVHGHLEDHDQVENVEWLVDEHGDANFVEECPFCGKSVGVVEYYNTEMDHETTREVLALPLEFTNPQLVERIDCFECAEKLHPEAKEHQG